MTYTDRQKKRLHSLELQPSRNCNAQFSTCQPSLEHFSVMLLRPLQELLSCNDKMHDLARVLHLTFPSRCFQQTAASPWTLQA